MVPPIVGRDSELAVVDAFLGDRGTGALTIVGEAGIGKTTLWREAVLRARHKGARVLSSRPTEAERKLSFAGLTDLLDGLDEDVFAALPVPQRDALDVVLFRAKTGLQPERRLVATAVLSVLRGLAAGGEVVVAVDDVPWLDAPSAAALDFAVRRLGDLPVRLLVSARSENERDAHVRLDGASRRLELGPLSVAALHRIVSEMLGTTFPRPTLVRIADASAGNPLYALEIARLLATTARSHGAVAMPVPEDLRALVAKRVASVPPRTRGALLRAAALARPNLSLVDARALEPAEEAGLVRVVDGRVEFVHPLYASAVYASASASRRSETHRTLADAVVDPVERARHLALSRNGPDEQSAREVETAARAARQRGAPEVAAELSAMALALLPDGSPRADELRLDLAESLLLASDFQAAAGLLEQLAAELPSGDLRARALLLLCEIDFWRRGESVATALVEEALGDAREPLIRARCHAAIAMYAGTVDLPKAARSARAALALVKELPDPNPDPNLVAAALGARVRADLFLGNGYDAEAAERALALEQPAPPAEVDTRVVFKLGQWLRYIDDLDGARERLEQAEQAANDEGDESSLANILLNRMVLETWAGDWEEAAHVTGRMRDAFDQLGVEVEGAGPWAVYLDAHAGRLEAVRAAAARPRPHEPIVVMIWSRCLGLAELAAGDVEAADRHLGEALAELDRVDFREPAIWRVDGDAIEAAVAVGDLDRAEGLVARFEERAARSQIPWNLAVSSRCRGMVLAARGELDEAAEALDRAVAMHERCPVPFARGRTLLVQGQVLRRLKRRREARVSLEAALTIFRRLGAEPWVARAEADLRRVEVRRAPDHLSATELRIAQLAASGLTNQEIAGKVFLSRKAVEANLARTYRKLEIRSRAQLARALDAREISPH